MHLLSRKKEARGRAIRQGRDPLQTTDASILASARHTRAHTAHRRKKAQIQERKPHRWRKNRQRCKNHRRRFRRKKQSGLSYNKCRKSAVLAEGQRGRRRNTNTEARTCLRRYPSKAQFFIMRTTAARAGRARRISAAAPIGAVGAQSRHGHKAMAGGAAPN